MGTTSSVKVVALSAAAAVILAMVVIGVLAGRQRSERVALADRVWEVDAFTPPGAPLISAGTAAAAVAAGSPLTVKPEGASARAFVEKYGVEPRAWQGLRMMNDNWVALLRKTRSDGRESDKLPLAAVAAEHQRFIAQTLETPARIDAYHAWVAGLAVVPVAAQGQDGKLYSGKEFK